MFTVLTVFTSARPAAPSSARRRPASRAAALLATAALAAGLAGTASPAAADDGTAADSGAAADGGTASAAVLRADLDVALLNGGVHAPLSVTLNELAAPHAQGPTAEQTALTAALDGVDGGRPFDVARADVATARATAEPAGSAAEVTLARAAVHVPGLPALSLLEVEEVTARATCAPGAAPTAEANVLGTVTALGEEVVLDAAGEARVDVPGVGRVSLALSERETTDTGAAASALRLEVAVDPLDLNVAEVTGRVTLAEVACETPAGAAPDAEADGPEAGESEADGPGEAERARDVSVAAEPGGAADGDADLAATGGDSATGYLAGGALALLGLGGATVFLARRGAARRRDSAS